MASSRMAWALTLRTSVYAEALLSLGRVLGHLMRQLAPLDFMLERATHDMVNETGGPKLDRQAGGHWFTTTLRHEQTYAELAHSLDGSSYIISSASTTAHDMRSRTTTVFPLPFRSATRLPTLPSPLRAQYPSRTISQQLSVSQHFVFCNPRYLLSAALQSSVSAICRREIISIVSSSSSGYRFLHVTLDEKMG